jgi:type II secretory pathway predicted ATPase ExeA
MMGLLTGLLTLPLAPIRGTVWIAEQIAEQAAREVDEGRTIRRQLAEAERRYERGELTVEELEEIEDELLERLRLAGELDATEWRR